MSPRLVIRNARVMAMDESGHDWPEADIVMENGRISAAGPGAGANVRDAQVIDAKGMLAMPGLINAHFHSPGNLMKGTLDGLPLELFMLYEVPPLADAGDAARVAYVRTMLGAIEMLERGITCVHDDAFHVPLATRETVDAIMQAYADCGMRATVAIDQPNIVEYDKYPFLKDLLPGAELRAMEAVPRQSGEELLALYQHLIERWHGSEGGRLQAAVSCSAPQRVTVDYFRGLSQLSKQHNLPFNIHVLETKLQRVLGEDKFGKSLVRYVHDLGLLDERMMVIHAIWVDDTDIALLAAAGCSVAHNPVCNLRLGSGVMPFYKLRAAGVPLCLGTDEATVDDTTNLWLVAKTAALLHTLGTPEYRDWPGAPEILATLFAGGARALRQAGKLGRIAAGCAADVILLDLDTAAFTPLNDLSRQLVFCEDGSSVRTVIVGGRVVCEDGCVTTVDARALRAEARELVARSKPQTDKAREQAARLEPYYREMVLRAAARDVGFNRWLA
jgi:cytosine/adenosine deaminase-related metal-dependent hydrolase